MGVASVQELARTIENELGGTPRAVRTFVLTLTNDTLQNNPTNHNAALAAISAATGENISNWGTAHPELAFLGVRKVNITERFSDSPYHIQVAVEYGVVSANELLAPTARAADWSFETKPSQVAALYYFDPVDDSKRPLTNSAYDYYEGLTLDELLVTAKITKNYQTFATANGPQDLINATNKINSSNYLGCPSHTWKVAGVQTEYVKEIHNNVAYEYWKVTSEIQYRQSSWLLLLPDVGWNFIATGQKRRAMVFDFQNSEWIASPNPVGLNGSGGLNFTAHPVINERRVNEEINFSPLFGNPPTV